MKTTLSSIVIALVLLLAPALARGVGVIAGPFTNTANAHLYYLLTQSTWTDAEAKARTLGGHLVTINDAAENQWVFDTFATLGGVRRLLWIGLTDIRSMGNFQWISGQPRTYENWSPVEPNNVGFEHYTLMYPPGIPADAFARYPGVWNNLRDWTSDIGLPLHGVIELEPSYWVGVAGFWADTNRWTPVYPNPNSVVVLHDGFLVYVNIIGAQVGALTLAPGSTVQVQTGAALDFYGPAVNHGSLVVAGNLTSYADGDAFVQNGTLNIASGGQVVAGGGNGGGYGFTQTGGQTAVDGTLCLGCAVGSGGSGVIEVQNGTLSVGSGGQVLAGTGNSGGYGFVQSGGAVTVAAGGTVSLSGGVSSGGSGLTLSGGSLGVNGTFNANGPAQVQGGALTIGVGGTICLGCAVGGGGSGLTQSGGSTVVNGVLNLGTEADPGSVDLYAGQLNGSGAIGGNLAADGGVLSPGSSPGTLTVSNDFALNGGGTLLIELAGRATNQFDQLKVGGAATLGGRLSLRLLNGFAPAPGDQFPILTAASVSGTFSGWDVPAGFSVNYSNTAVFLVVTGTVPAQIIGPTVSGGNLVFSFGTVSNRSYTVQFNDDLTTTNWLFYTDLIGNGGLMGFTTSVTNAPQRFFRVKQP